MSTRQEVVSSRQCAVSSNTNKLRRERQGERIARLLTAHCSLSTFPLHFNINQILWIETLHEIHHLIVLEHSIAGFDDQKKTITRRQRKVGRVEYRMIRLRQL